MLIVRDGIPESSLRLKGPSCSEGGLRQLSSLFMGEGDAAAHYEEMLRKAEELTGKQPDKAAKLCEQVLRDVDCGIAPGELRVRALYNLAMAHAHAGFQVALWQAFLFLFAFMIPTEVPGTYS